MAIVISNITVAQTATIINATITILQYSLSLALVALLLYFLPPSNSANSWTVAAREVQTSLWPTILRCTSESHASAHINFFSKLSFISALLVAVCGIVTPLGLKQGPAVQSKFHPVDAFYIEDNSPLGLATLPHEDFKHGRICGANEQVICPGNSPDTINWTEIPPPILETFSSTPHSPFNMQFRRYFTGRAGYNFSMTLPQFGMVQSMALHEGISAAKGVIIDMSDSPGIGLLNHTIPLSKEGATWSQEMLWLEPVTNCVNINLTVDYVLTDELEIDNFNLTDRGGFVNLTTVYPTMSLDGQNINLYEHSYKGAVLSNRSVMRGLNNVTRNESYIGKSYPLHDNILGFDVGFMSTIGLTYLWNTTVNTDSDTLCRGYGGADKANISNVSVQCGMFAGPPRRTDGGDERIPSLNSTWSQTLHICASATRASIQTVTFAINSSKEVSDLQITRTASNTSVLWAVEKTDLKIKDIDLFWGRVADKYESDPSLWTIRSNALYVPAGGIDFFGKVFSGQPSIVPSIAWSRVYNTGDPCGPDGFDYTGRNNYALQTKWQLLLAKNPELGHAQIRNLIWTDIVANNLVGMETHFTLVAASLEPSVTYDLRYGIPLLVLFIIWVPSFFTSVFVLLLDLLKISHILNFVDHSTVGRLALGHSALTPADGIPPDSEPICLSEEDWQKTAGRTIVSFRHIIPNELPKSPAASE